MSEYLSFPVILEICRFQMNILGLSEMNFAWNDEFVLLHAIRI